MNQFELIAETRQEVGKGANRRLRRTGKLPGIVYGNNKAVNMITLNHNDVMHQLAHEAFYSHILTLKIGDTLEKVVLKDLQRHPYKRSLLHIDLQRINENETLTMRVPLHFINEDRCIGVKQGGAVISHLMSEIDIVCLPEDLPTYIEVDMLEVDVGETLHLSDLKFPDRVQPVQHSHGEDNTLPVVSVHMPKGTTADEEEELKEETDSKEADTTGDKADSQ